MTLPARCGEACALDLPVLRPQLPEPDCIRPWLERIHSRACYTNFGPLCVELDNCLSQNFSGLSGKTVAACSLSSGTAGLELALAKLCNNGGRKVLLPSLTFPATATAVVRAGLIPWLVDVEANDESWSMSVADVERVISEHGVDDLAAVVPVATFGRPQDPCAWDGFTQRTGIPVIIDAAGAYGNQRVGKTTSAVFSMHATKSLPCGEGGVFASADAALVEQIRSASNFGFQDMPGIVAIPGTNAKLSEYHAAVALASLAQWPATSQTRLALAAAYADEIHATCHDKVMLQDHGKPWIRSSFVVRFAGHLADSVSESLARDGIESRRWYWPPLHDHPAFAGLPRADDLTHTKKLAGELLGLPFHLAMGEKEIQHVCASLQTALS